MKEPTVADLTKRCILVRKIDGWSATMMRVLPAEDAYNGREVRIDGETWTVRMVIFPPETAPRIVQRDLALPPTQP